MEKTEGEKIASLFFNFSYLLLAVAFCFFMQRILFLQTAKKAQGIVTSISESKGIRNATVINATIEFKTVSSEKKIFSITVFDETSSFILGNSVKIYYQPNNPSHALPNDFMYLWSPILWSAGSGMIIWLIGFLCIFFMKR